MKFPVSSREVTPPLALQELDDTMGTQTEDAYIAAVNRAPHLGGLAVIQEERTPSFKPSKLGLAGSYVAIHPNRDFYLEAIRSGKATRRLGEFSNLYRSMGIAPSVNELVVAVLLHEMGHADDFGGYITKASGNTAAAFELSREVRNSQLATLPLGAATARAERAWQQNIEGYRDRLRSQGFTNKKWTFVLEQNIRAYSELPCEQVADRFALGVLATIHSEI